MRSRFYASARGAQWAVVAVLALAGGLSCGGGNAGGFIELRVRSGALLVAGWDSGDPPTLHPRCRTFTLAAVPDDYAAFEKVVQVWIATCVASQSGAHRERALVRGNLSLATLHRSLVPGRAARIVPRYTWGAYRVERITFDSPDAVADGADAADARDRLPSSVDRDGDPGRIPRRDEPPEDGDEPPEDSDEPPSGDLPAVEPPDDLVDLPDDLRRLIALLRARGADADADRLERLLERAAPVLVDIALIAGGYYLATKLRGGVLLFQWGWTAHGLGFQRALARLDRALPGAERAIGALTSEIRAVASRNPGLVGGAGVDWKVIDEVVDGSVPAQLDGLACGPACVKMVLSDRGIHVDHARIVEMGAYVVSRRDQDADGRCKRVATPVAEAGPLGRLDRRSRV